MAEKKTKNSAVQDARLRDDIASFKSSVAFLLYSAVIFFTATNLQYNKTSLRVPISIFFGNNPWIMIFPLILFGLSAYWLYSNRKKKKDEGFSYFSSDDAFVITLFILVFALAFAMSYSVALLIAVTVGFALCYYSTRLFSKDFMVATFMNAAFAMLLWLIGGTSATTGVLPTIAKVVFLVLSILAITAAAAVTVMVMGGKLGAFKGSYIPVIISFVIGAALCVVLLAAPAVMSLMLAEIILLVQYVVLGVYYTVRLLNQ